MVDDNRTSTCYATNCDQPPDPDTDAEFTLSHPKPRGMDNLTIQVELCEEHIDDPPADLSVPITPPRRYGTLRDPQLNLRPGVDGKVEATDA